MSSYKLLKLSILPIVFFMSNAFAENRIEGIAAVIGDSIILNSELDAYTTMRLNTPGQQIDTTKIMELKKQFLNEMIDGKVLLVHAAKDTNITIREAEIDQAVNNHIQMILQQNNISMETLEKELADKYNTTLSKFKSQMRSQVQDQIVRQKVQQMYILPYVQVSRNDVETFYNQYADSLPELGESLLMSVLTIHLAATDSIRQVAFNKISEIRHKIDKGEPFDSLAKQYSEDPSAENGGDLGFIKKGTLSELAFEEKVFSLGKNQTSDVFETRLGFHIVRVTEKKDQAVHVYQIFVRVAPADDYINKITSRLDSIKTNCHTENDFIAAIKNYGTDKKEISNSGRMGWKSLYDLPEDLRSAVDSLKQGDISKPVKDGDDFHLYRIDERKSQRKMTMEDDYAFLMEKTREITAQKKLIDLVNRWRKDIFVEIRL
jgi:peptidyl-prolyl cis-trans isomerase SurA